MKPEEFLKTTLNDIKVDLTKEFILNFERKAFFDKKWDTTKLKNHRGSLMLRSKKLRGSIRSKLTHNGITFDSSMPYAAIHNEGGQIVVTEKMKRYFWAMYYKCTNAVKPTKTGKVSNSQRNQRLTEEAKQWKAMALKKTGSKIKIPQRQFVGHHPDVDRLVNEIIRHNVKELKIKPFEK